LELNHFYTQNRIPIILLCTALFVFGSISLFYLDFNLLPDIEYPELTVITSYPNASPEEVTHLVSIPIEQIALSLKGVKHVETLSREGMSIVRVQYRWGEDLSIAHIELREKMDLLKSFFPEEVKRPVIIHYSTASDAVMGISVLSTSMDGRSLYLLCRKDIKASIEQTEGVSRATLLGGERPEVHILVDPELLIKYNVGITEIKNILGLSNKNFPVGFFQDDKYEYLVRVNGEVSDYREFEDIVIKEENKKLVFLKDVAQVQYGTMEKESDVIINGENALMLSVFKRPSYNIIKVTKKLDEQIGRLNERYAGDIVFHKVFDESAYIRHSLKELIIAMIAGILFTIFSVYIFLRNLKISVLIIATIPLSIISTFIIMKLLGVSINLLTLGGFSLAVGMIVDNAVIVVMSVFDLLFSEKKSRDVYSKDVSKKGFSKKDFSLRLRAVIPAVCSATFTTIVVFFPVLFLSGILKHIFLQLSLVIIVSLLFSLVMSVTIIPAILIKIRVKKKPHLLPSQGFLELCYSRILFVVLKKKFLFIIALCGVISAGLISYRALDKRFIESIPQNHFYVKIFIHKQVPFDYTRRFTNYVSALIKREKGVSKIIASVGVDKADAASNLQGIYGTNTAVLKIYTHARGTAVYDLIDKIRKSLDIFSDVDFIITIPDNPVQRMVSRSDFDAVIKTFDPSPENLRNRVAIIKSFLAQQGTAEDVLSSHSSTQYEHSFILKRKELSMYKIDAPFLGEFIASAVTGLKVGTWKRDEHEIPILLKFQSDSWAGVQDILALSIKNNQGQKIKLHEVLDLKEVSAPPGIMRENQRTFAKVEFNFKKGRKSRQIPFFSDEKKKGIHSSLSSIGFECEYTDQFTLLRENYSELILALMLAVFLEYIILASMFRSFSKPLLIIAMIPLSLPGILLVLYILHSSLNINTFMSMVVVIGLVVNNAIMLFLEYRDARLHDEVGIISASVRRVKPIMITTISTILALIPVLFTGNKIQISLAATLIIGLLYSTGLTLLYLPMFYTFFYIRRKNKTIGLR